MFAFIKKLLGYPTEAEKAAAKSVQEAPYKVEAPVVDLADIAIAQRPTQMAAAPKVEEVVVAAPVVNSQITDAVTQVKPAAMKAKKKPASKKPAGEKKAPAKKPGRKPKSAKS